MYPLPQVDGFGVGVVGGTQTYAPQLIRQPFSHVDGPVCVQPGACVGQAIGLQFGVAVGVGIGVGQLSVPQLVWQPLLSVGNGAT